MTLLRTLLLTVPFATAAHAQAPFQLDLYSDSDTVLATLTTYEGRNAFALSTATGNVLWMGSDQGEPLWARALPAGPTDWQLFQGHQGNIVAVGAFPPQQIMTGTSDDTVVHRLSVHCVGANGSPQWEREVRIQYLVPYESHVEETIAGTDLPDGGLLLSIWNHSTFLSGGVMHVLRFDGEGGLVWVRRLGNDPAPTVYHGPVLPIELYDSENWGLHMWSASPDGYTAVMKPSTFHVTAFHLTADGIPAWSKRYRYVNTEVYPHHHTVLALDTGDPLIAFRTFSGAQPALVTLRLDQAGVVIDKDLYRGAAMPILGKPLVARLGNDERTFLLPGTSALLMSTDANGELGDAHLAQPVTTGDYTFTSSYRSLSGGQNGRVMNFSLERLHNVFNYTDHFVGSTTLSPSDPGCFFQPVTVEHFDIPDSMIVQEELTLFGSIAVQLDITEGTPFAEAAPIGTGDLCALVLGTPILEEAPAFTLVNTVAARNTGWTAQANVPVSGVALFDTHGRLVRTERPTTTGTITISANGLAPGMYLLEVRGTNGAPLARTKVLVD